MAMKYAQPTHHIPAAVLAKAAAVPASIP